MLERQSSLNRRCDDRMTGVRHQLADFGVVEQVEAGASVVFDFGVLHPGTVSGGLLLAELCMAGLGTVTMLPPTPQDLLTLPSIVVRTDAPFSACMASQYAGWPLSVGRYFAMVSGPARALRGREPLFEKYPCAEQSASAWAILETAQLPSDEVARQIASECGVDLPQLRVCAARTASLAGTIQIVARSVETAMHKLLELDFDVRTVRSGIGSAPLPPVGNDDLQSIGWTNDAILYGSSVWLAVHCEQSAVDNVIEQIPASSSSAFGRPFREIFEGHQRDFYAIDKMLFSPAQITIANLRTGLVRHAGRCEPELLRESFGMGKSLPAESEG